MTASIKLLVVLALFSSNAFCRDTLQTRLNDSAVKQQIIQESIATYSGNCPCPYNTMRNGRACGGRSAYSRPSGAAPLCYERDITKEMVQSWRNEHESTISLPDKRKSP